MACANVDMSIHGGNVASCNPRQGEQSIVQHYQASEMMPDKEGPLHDLLQKQPAVLGSIQIVSGLLSVGVGVLFAFSLEMQHSLFTMFRVAHLTGTLFIIAGVFSNLLFKYPKLLTVSFMVNFCSIIIAAVSACLISVDLANWSPELDSHLRMELLALCVLGLEILLSAILCFWFLKEKRAKLP